MSIERFRHKALRRFYTHDDPRGLPAAQIEKIRDILRDTLTALQEAAEPSDVGLFPGWRLHRLKGDLGGLWSATVTGNWRIVFRFEDGKACDIDFIDYH
jgi:proteic killer suppression protein